MLKKFVQDDDCHWYLIPSEEYGTFLECLEYYCHGVVAKDDWDDKWGDFECKHPACYEVIVKEEG